MKMEKQAHLAVEAQQQSTSAAQHTAQAQPNSHTNQSTYRFALDKHEEEIIVFVSSSARAPARQHDGEATSRPPNWTRRPSTINGEPINTVPNPPLFVFFYFFPIRTENRNPSSQNTSSRRRLGPFQAQR